MVYVVQIHLLSFVTLESLVDSSAWNLIKECDLLSVYKFWLNMRNQWCATVLGEENSNNNAEADFVSKTVPSFEIWISSSLLRSKVKGWCFVLPNSNIQSCDEAYNCLRWPWTSRPWFEQVNICEDQLYLKHCC